MSCRNYKEKVRGHGHGDGAHYAKPFVHSETPQHYEKAYKIAEEKPEDGVEKESGELSEELIHIPDDSRNRITRILYRNLIRRHTGKHRIGPVGRHIRCLVILLQGVRHTFPLHSVALA